jgi:hypothetical protein
MESELMRNLGSQLGNIQMQGSAAAYDKAGQLYQQDYANQMAKAQTLQQLGLTDEARRQRDLDAMYQEFQQQRDYPSRQAQQYRDIVFGGPGYKTESTYESTGNPLVQGLGLARLLYGGL